MKKKYIVTGIFAAAILVGLGTVNVFSENAAAGRAGDKALSDTGNAPLVDGRIERDNFYSQVGKLLQAEKFDQLDTMADNLRNTRPRLPGGDSKLAVFYSGLTSGGKLENQLQLLQKWADARPDSATARIALARNYINYAWQARGGDWASEVTGEGWKLFAERLKKARGILEETEKMTTKDPCLYDNSICVAIGEGWDREKMEEVFKKGVAADPTYYPLYYSKANYLMPRWHGEPGDWVKFAEEAADMTKKTEGASLYTRIIQIIILRHKGSGEFKLDTGIFERSNISWPKFKQGYEDKIRLYPGSLGSAHAFCFFACLAQDRETAKRLFARINNRPNEEIWGEKRTFERLQNLVNDETTDDSAFREKISRFYQTANDVQDYIKQADILDRKGDYAEAILEYNKAIKIDPDFAQLYLNRGYVYFEKREYDKAISDYTQAIKIDPTDKDAYIARGDTYYYNNLEFDKAISDYTEAIKLDPDFAWPYLSRGNIYRFKKEYDKAISDYTQAIKIDPIYKEAYIARGDVYENNKEYDKAISDCSQVIKINPNLAEGYRRRGDKYSKNKEYDKAIFDYSQIIKINPNLAEGYKRRGDVYSNKKEYDKAISDYTEAIRVEPKQGLAYTSRGIAYFQKGNYDKAWEDVQKAQSLGRWVDPELLEKIQSHLKK